MTSVAAHPLVEIVRHLERGVGAPRLLAGLVDDLGHEAELGRVDEPHVHAEAREQKRQALRRADRLLVARGAGPADRRRATARVAEALDDRHEIGERLVRMEDVALHVEDGDPARRGDLTLVGVADLPVDVADGDAVVVAAEDLTDLLGGVAVGDLGRAALDELGVAPELRHARLERRPRPRAREKEQHREDLVPQKRVGPPERPVALQAERHLEHGVDLVLGPLAEVDDVPTPKMCLHSFAFLDSSQVPATTPRRRARGPTTPCASRRR